jgi:hypothetical protein
MFVAATPAAFMARVAAIAAISVVVSDSAAMCRWTMPVIARIQWSLVSILASNSEFVMTFSGK